ncbi:MAG: SUMF1/EgtB/PvdO family nonheme iron enzyme [Anaerolineae bacterium]|nr:SUMF1/EgtB/PvdO family nonheme iron enzyme [Anaerolineae bacterium]
MTRKTDLEQSIRESYAILRDYEAIIRTSDRPEEKGRARRIVGEQWALVQGYLAEYRPLVQDRLPDEIAQLSARFAALEELGKVEQVMQAQEQFRGVLPDDQIEAALTTLRDKRQSLHAQLWGDGGIIAQGGSAVNTGSGIAVAGGVRGDVVIGNHTTEIAGDGNVVGDHNVVQLYKVYQAAPGRARLDEAEFRKVLLDYLGWVRREYGSVRLHGLQNLQQTGALDKPLSRIYTSLRVQHRPAVESGGEAARTRHGRREQLADVEFETAESRPLDMADLLTLGERVAIIGRAGSGKTTYLAFVASTLASALLGHPLDVRLKPPQADAPLPAPLLAPLRFWQVYREQCAAVNRYDRPEAGTLGAFLLWFLRARYKNFDAAEDFFERLLRGGNGCLILLDGLDEVVQVAERRVVRDEVERLLTSQYPGNRCLVTAREAGYRDAPFGGDFVRCDVQPLAEAQVAALVQAWCSQIYTQPHDGEVACEDLTAVINRLNAERQRRGQPAWIDTPLLVTMVVSVKYSRRELPRERAKLYDACVDVILNSEYTGREDDAGARRGVVNAGGPPDKQREWLSYLAFQMHQGGQAGASLDEGRLQAILNPVFAQRGELPLLEPFLAAVGHRGGLFEERGGRYQFTHLTFQEYLTAQFLARRWQKQPEGLLAQLVADEWWREALLLTVGSLDAPLPYEQREEFIKALCAVEGPMAARLAGAELAATGLGDLTDPEPALLALARARLADLWRAPDFSTARAVVRAGAGNALARLGDPRFRADAWFLPDEPLLGFVEIPAGPFLMGSDDGYSDEKPQHTVSLSTYYIARYPTTVSQFRAFVEQSGHQPLDPDCLRGIDNHPVVYVTWHDALAYCRWLTGQLREGPATPPALTVLLRQGWQVRLPSEAEWEKAARGAPPLSPPHAGGMKGGEGEGRGRIYPWGPNADPNRANYDDTGIGDTSAVGCFPGGASPYDVLDLSGNVWEWCSSLYQDYPYRPDRREDLNEAASSDAGVRVLRGGAFGNSFDSVRCSLRFGYNPYYRYDVVGFRIVMVSPSLRSGL